MRVFGTKSTTYSAPRYSSVWPRWRPKPLTSVTVIPDTPISESAARTSSSLNGLMMAVINFIQELHYSIGAPRQSYYYSAQPARPYALGAPPAGTFGISLGSRGRKNHDRDDSHYRRRTGRCPGHGHFAPRGFRRAYRNDRR